MNKNTVFFFLKITLKFVTEIKLFALYVLYLVSAIDPFLMFQRKMKYLHDACSLMCSRSKTMS